MKNFLCVTIPSIIFLIFFIEVFLRLFVPVSDAIFAKSYGKWGLHLAPNQEGWYIKGFHGEIKGKVMTNSYGWNSIHEYSELKHRDILRVAVIGDSFVEAMQVDASKSVASILEKLVRKELSDIKKYRDVEVYSFGSGGAPLSQYLNVMRYVATYFAPDIYIIIVTHNDFLSSLTAYGNRYFLTFEDDTQGGFREIAPEEYTPSKIKRMLAFSDIIRYLYFNLYFEQRFSFLKNLFRSGSKSQINPDLEKLQSENMETLHRLTFDIFRRFCNIAEEHDAKLLIISNCGRPTLYRNSDIQKSKAYKLNLMIRNEAENQNIGFMDLTDAFREDFESNNRKHFFERDGHWNERGHAIAAKAISEKIEEILSGP